MDINRKIIVIGALLAALSVVLGAFAAHGLENYVAPEKITSFQIGVRYSFNHALAIIVLGLIPEYLISFSQKTIVLLLFLLGSLLFSVSIYLLVLNSVWEIAWLRFLGPVTPIGGVLMILGWLMMAHCSFYSKK